MESLAATLGADVKSGALPLLEALHALQESDGYLRRESLEALGRAAQLPIERLHSVATFYTNFALAPKPAQVLRVCVGLPCLLAGGGRALEAARELAAGLPDEIAVETFPCLGQCDGAPASLRNYDVVRGREEDLAPHPRETRVILDGAEDPRARSLAGYRARGGYAALEAHSRAADPDALIATVKATGLRGMGGAGFPTAVKWDTVRRARGARKFVVVNADEGEPGTIKDRVLMERLPHRLLEGVYLAALAVGADEAWIYIRDEYRRARELLLAAIGEVAADPSLSDLAKRTPVRICRGAGSYVCGEESALLESLEGKRGEPRLRPPFPAEVGLFGLPTAVNNVETLAAVAALLARPGAEAKTKLCTLSGPVARPGVFEVALGTPVRALVEEMGGGVTEGRGVKAFFTAGLAAGFLPGSALDLPIDGPALQKAGAALGCASFIVVPTGECIARVVEEALAFFAHESCGKCTPCRVGTEKMTETVRGWRTRGGAAAELALMEELAPVIVDASICGLGQFAPKPYQDAIRHFKEEMEEHALARRCREGVCFRAE